jgi:hypothetical protein
MYSVCDDLKGRVSPFGNLRIKACLLAPRSLSQATTSFIACNRQGIHHVHLVTCPYNVGLCCAVLPFMRTPKTGHRSYYILLSFVCRIQSVIAWCTPGRCTPFENSLIHCDYNHTHRRMLSHASTNLYFFSIVKERNSQWFYL